MPYFLREVSAKQMLLRLSMLQIILEVISSGRVDSPFSSMMVWALKGWLWNGTRVETM